VFVRDPKLQQKDSSAAGSTIYRPSDDQISFTMIALDPTVESVAKSIRRSLLPRGATTLPEEVVPYVSGEGRTEVLSQ
jgi:hypothetical protein